MVSSGMGSEVVTAGVGVLAPIGTIPTSARLGEGEGVVRAGPEESDVALRRVTASELVWAEAVQLDISVINKKAPQKGRLFILAKPRDFKTGRQVRFRQYD